MIPNAGPPPYERFGVNGRRADDSIPRQSEFDAPNTRPNHACSAFNDSTSQKTSLDFTQRIERKLAEYNASENVFKRWLFEIGSWLISAICMGAVIGIYIWLKDNPMSRAGQLLTYTNVLGKVASAALIVPTSEALGQLKWNWFHKSKAMWDFEIFDKASRGPIGAMLLLYRTKGRSLAALGAVILVLLLAIDTFFQQVVNLSDRWTLETIASEVPRMVRYRPAADKVFRDGFEQAVDDDDMFLLVQKYSYGNGTHTVPYGNGTRPNIPVSCPTSNCTWPVYETFGICSKCVDVSSQLTFACLDGKLDWTSQVKGGYHASSLFLNGSMCGYFLNATSDTPVMMSGYEVTLNGTKTGEALLGRILPLTTMYDRWPLYGNGSLSFKSLRNTIVDLIIVSAANGTAASVYDSSAPVAQECVLSWCVQTIKSLYNQGQYKEEILDVYENTTAGEFPWTSFPYSTDYENGTDIFFLQDINIDLGEQPNGRNISGFGTSNITASAINYGFVDINPAFTIAVNESATPVLRYKTWQREAPFHRILEFNPWLAPNNVSIHMQRLATAMTNQIRSTEQSNEMVLGSSFSREVFIHVRWGWLAFPLALLILSMIFLVSTMIKTSKENGTGIWKTSAMPTLIYGLPKEAQSKLADTSTWHTAEGTKKMRIKLLPNMGWRVSGQSHLSRSPRLPSGERVPRGWL